MPRSEVTIFTVRGKGRFPTDMLRYDMSHPTNESDSAVIDNVDNDHKVREVQLTSYKRYGPTPGRWESFGWRVVS